MNRQNIYKTSRSGLGDVVYQFIGKENSEKFKAWHLKTFKKPCGCDKRREQLNKLFPLS